jgi:predicted nucleotidyltransferase
MPVRSLNSSVFAWPGRNEVDQAARTWAQAQSQKHPELRALAYFGSYARGNWGVGSDLDLIAIVNHSSEPFERRSLQWELHLLPVPTELLVYTAEEWEQMRGSESRFVRMLRREAVWIFP